MLNDTEIIVIDDNYKSTTPLLLDLREKYGESMVLLFNQPNEGIEYVKGHLSKKMVLIIDIQFAKGEPRGVQLLEEIREVTSLVYVILITADLGGLTQEELIRCVNNDALAILDKKSGYENILKKATEAVHLFDVRVASALEQWISSHPEEERKQPYIFIPPNRTLNLNELLQEVLLQTDLGRDFERKIIYLSIDLLARQKETI